ncbi:MAG: hypothetical protein NTY22_01070, partial [Proteobacteria bacterium]|nr:hypothetical protein [Pseudomonadota bacterium]
FTGLLLVTACIFSINVFAESSKLTKVDIDVKTTQIVKADLDIDDFYYYIDTNACVCWLSRLIGGAPAVATVDCTKLAAHSKLEQYVSKCITKPVEVKKEEIIVEVKKDEVADNEKNKEKDKDKNKGKDKEKKDKDKKDKDKKDKKDIKEVKAESDKVLEDVMGNK